MMLGFLALLGWTWIAPPCETGFCSCVGPRDVPSAVASAEAVFTGTVVAVRDTMIGTRAEYGPFSRRKVTLRVDRAWKGVASQTVVVLTGQGGGDCGFPFERGESYLVYADGGSGEPLATGICGRTAALSHAAADVRALGEPSRRWPHRSRWFRWFHRRA
jgi:hypothetical protein